MSDLFSKIKNIKTSLDTIRLQITQLDRMNKEHLASVSSSQSKSQQTISNLQQEIQDSIRRIQSSIKSLDNCPNESVSIKLNQQKLLAKRLMELTNDFQQLQTKIKQSQQSQIKRLVRINHPDATDDEINQVISGDKSSYLNLNTTSMQQAQSRHQQLIKIEQNIQELYTIFQDLQLLIDIQDERVNDIETHVEQTVVYVHDSSKKLTCAIQSSKSSRKKKWCCFFVFLVLLIGLGLFLYFQIFKEKDKK